VFDTHDSPEKRGNEPDQLITRRVAAGVLLSRSYRLISVSHDQLLLVPSHKRPAEPPRCPAASPRSGNFTNSSQVQGVVIYD